MLGNYHRGDCTAPLPGIHVWGCTLCCYQEICQHHLVLFLFQTGVGGGMSSNVTSMSRPDMGGMGGSYAGANDMVNNGLSANQNQVSLNDILVLEF